MDNYIKKYLKQTNHTDPQNLAYLFEDIPKDINVICKTVNSLLIHPSRLSQYPDIKVSEDEIWLNEPKTVYDILQKLASKNTNSLLKTRTNNERVVITCRGFTILLTAILRHKGVPARARAGFAPYIVNEVNIDHWICEYWNDDENRWVLLDADFMKIDFSPNEFHYTAEALLNCLSEKDNPFKFGCDDNWGFSYMLSYLNLDLLCLVCDEPWYNPKTALTDKLHWGGKTTYQDATQKLTEAEKNLLIDVAKLMLYPKENYRKLVNIINENSKLLPSMLN